MRGGRQRARASERRGAKRLDEAAPAAPPNRELRRARRECPVRLGLRARGCARLLRRGPATVPGPFRPGITGPTARAPPSLPVEVGQAPIVDQPAPSTGAALAREAERGAQGLSPMLATRALIRRGPTAVAAPIPHPGLGEVPQRRGGAEHASESEGCRRRRHKHNNERCVGCREPASRNRRDAIRCRAHFARASRAPSREQPPRCRSKWARHQSSTSQRRRPGGPRSSRPVAGAVTDREHQPPRTGLHPP